MLLNLLWMESRVHPFKTQAVTLHLKIVIQKRTVIAMNALIFGQSKYPTWEKYVSPSTTLKSTVPSPAQTIVEVLVR